jgi:hypothetical protein
MHSFGMGVLNHMMKAAEEAGHSIQLMREDTEWLKLGEHEQQ